MDLYNIHQIQWYAWTLLLVPLLWRGNIHVNRSIHSFTGIHRRLRGLLQSHWDPLCDWRTGAGRFWCRIDWTMKTKTCPSCKQDKDVMFRIQRQKGKEWLFVCKECLPSFQKLPHYRYGGTWKGYRHWGHHLSNGFQVTPLLTCQLSSIGIASLHSQSNHLFAWKWHNEVWYQLAIS